jgi:hypothetical protein
VSVFWTRLVLVSVRAEGDWKDKRVGELGGGFLGFEVASGWLGGSYLDGPFLAAKVPEE